MKKRGQTSFDGYFQDMLEYTDTTDMVFEERFENWKEGFYIQVGWKRYLRFLVEDLGSRKELTAEDAERLEMAKNADHWHWKLQDNEGFTSEKARKAHYGVRGGEEFVVGMFTPRSIAAKYIEKGARMREVAAKNPNPRRAVEIPPKFNEAAKTPQPQELVETLKPSEFSHMDSEVMDYKDISFDFEDD